MGQGLKEILLMERKEERVCFSGVMERFMMDNGIMARNMEVGCGKVLRVIHILVNGKMERLKALEFFS